MHKFTHATFFWQANQIKCYNYLKDQSNKAFDLIGLLEKKVQQ